MGNSAERCHFQLLCGEWQQGDRDPGSASGYSQGVPLVSSAVDTKELLVMQDSVVNANLQGQQVKPVCEPSCLCGVWGQLGVAYACLRGGRHPSSHHVFPCWPRWSLIFVVVVTLGLCCCAGCSLVVASRAYSSCRVQPSHCGGFSLQSTGSRLAGSVTAAPRLSCSMACGILLA